uniref:PTB domain-containing protein n=1 Tax=Naja naja TaxID=35670 RepID=A0A8C6VP37_NAJNA
VDGILISLPLMFNLFHSFLHYVINDCLHMQMALPYSTSWCLLYTDCFTTVTCRFRVCIKEPKSIFDPQHLLTCTIDGKEINNVENCIERLKMMDAQSQVWGQDMLLQIKENKLLLTDIEAEEELDCYPLEDIQDWVSILNRCIYHSILAISVKDLNEQKTSILLFQCDYCSSAIMSPTILSFIKLDIPNSSNLSLYVLTSSPLTIFVALLCTFSRVSASFLQS